MSISSKIVDNFIANGMECKAADTAKVLRTPINSKKMTIIVSKCDSANIKVPVITKDPVVICDRFNTAVQARWFH